MTTPAAVVQVNPPEVKLAGTVTPGGTGTVTVIGPVVGPVPTLETVTGTLDWTPAWNGATGEPMAVVRSGYGVPPPPAGLTGNVAVPVLLPVLVSPVVAGTLMVIGAGFGVCPVTVNGICPPSVAPGASGPAAVQVTVEAAVVQVNREREVGGVRTCTTHYYLTSYAGTAAELGRWVRGHWGIENGLHWVLDVVFREDRSRIREENAGANLAMVRRVAVHAMSASSWYMSRAG